MTDDELAYFFLSHPGKYRFYDNGAIHVYFDMDDNGNGEYIYFHRNGQLSFRCTYISDKLNGEWKEYDEGGETIKHVMYQDGEVVADFLENPQLKKEYGVEEKTGLLS